MQVVSGCAELMRMDVTREWPALFPLFDVSLTTYADGFMLAGYARKSETTGGRIIIREHRQAWYCVPVQPS